jgi:hypothetical protein
MTVGYLGSSDHLRSIKSPCVHIGIRKVLCFTLPLSKHVVHRCCAICVCYLIKDAAVKLYQPDAAFSKMTLRLLEKICF